MRLAATVLGVLACLAVLFGFLALDFIPHRMILAAMAPAERAHADSSVIEMEWVSRGLHSIGAGCVLLFAALVTYLLSLRTPRSRGRAS